MKKLVLFILLAMPVYAALPQGCGGMPTGMNLSAVTTSCIKGSFYRPEVPEKYRSDPNEIEYEKYFVISYRAYFTQGDPDKFYAIVDTSEQRYGRTVIGNAHQAFFENTGLWPGVSYEVCVYTSCDAQLVGPLCYSTTTTLEAPYDIKRDSLSDIPGKYFFEPRKDTHVLADDVVLEYRASNTAAWTTLHPSPYGFVIPDIQPGQTYLARYKVIYAHGTESHWSDPMIIQY